MTFVPPTNDAECIDRVCSLLRHGKVDATDRQRINDAVKFAIGAGLGEALAGMLKDILPKGPLIEENIKFEWHDPRPQAYPETPIKWNTIQPEDTHHLIGYIDSPDLRRDGTEGPIRLPEDDRSHQQYDGDLEQRDNEQGPYSD